MLELDDIIKQLASCLSCWPQATHLSTNIEVFSKILVLIKSKYTFLLKIEQY